MRVNYEGKDEISSLYASFNQMAVRLAKQETIRQQFISDVSHEFQTPLTAISGFATILKNENLTDEQRQKYADIILFNSNRLSHLSKNMLQLTLLDGEDTSLDKSEFPLIEQLNRVIEMEDNAALSKDIEIEFIHPKKEFIIEADESRMEQVWINLLSNAIKYTQKGSVTLFVESEQTGADEILLKMAVIDTGMGIRQDDMKYLFDSFKRVNEGSTKGIEGTGLGLSICSQLVNLMGGQITVDSIYQKGSTFTVTIPQKIVNAAPLGNLNYNSSSRHQRSSYKKSFEAPEAKVLVVDDNDMNLLVAKKLLRETKVQLALAHSGMECLKLTAKNNYDVIFMDHMMPEMDGLELCSKVKSEISYSHIPVILLTAKTTLESKIEGLECGADVYVEKPFSVKQLHMQIENLLKLRQSFHKLMVSLAGDTVAVSTTDFAMSQKDCEFIAKIQGVIAEQLADENFSIDTLAEQMNMSRSNFYRKIKALSGMSPNDYLKTLRMNRAAELIVSGTRISEVAAQVGFTSSSYFAKCFKAQYGVLPKEYTGQPLSLIHISEPTRPY